MKTKNNKQITNNKKLANFLFEAATLKRLKRTGWQILGGNQESIAEHSFLVCIISYILANELRADIKKVLVMSLFHDFEEARTGDVYRLADQYLKVDKMKALRDAFSNLPTASAMILLIQEYEERRSIEAKIVKDADTLALMLELKQLIERGDNHAREWFEANFEALSLKESLDLAKEIKNSDSQGWWRKERDKIHKVMPRK